MSKYRPPLPGHLKGTMFDPNVDKTTYGSFFVKVEFYLKNKRFITEDLYMTENELSNLFPRTRGIQTRLMNMDKGDEDYETKIAMPVRVMWTCLKTREEREQDLRRAGAIMEQQEELVKASKKRVAIKAEEIREELTAENQRRAGRSQLRPKLPGIPKRLTPEQVERLGFGRVIEEFVEEASNGELSSKRKLKVKKGDKQ